MRILVNHYTPSPNSITGITAYTWSIVEALAACPGQDILLCTNWDTAHLPKALLDKGVTARHLPTWHNESAALVGRSLSVPGIARRYDADIIFTPLYYQVPFSRAARVTVVHDLYNLTFPAWYGAGRHAQWAVIFPQSVRRSDMMLCVSAATRDDLVRFYPSAAEKCAVVHEASALATSASPAEVNPIGEQYCLIVANVEPNKNVPLLLDAARLLAGTGRSIRFVLVGRDRGGHVAKFCEQAKEVRLTHIQDISDDELATLYKHARCYVNTSLAEGFCLPILEAQGLDTPVICSDIPVLREVAGEGAIFINPKDPQSLADAIRRVFDDDELAGTLARAGAENFRKFSWARAARETIQVFEQAIERRKSSDVGIARLAG